MNTTESSSERLWLLIVGFVAYFVLMAYFAAMLLDQSNQKDKPMKFKQYLCLISGLDGFFATPHLRWVIRTNPSPTAREEAIAAKVIEQANPRENITGHFPWGPEQQFVLQQLWTSGTDSDWRDVPIKGAEDLYSTEDGLPVPNIIKEPGMVQGNFGKRLNEILGDDIDDSE